MAVESSAVISAVGKLHNQGSRRIIKSTKKGPAAPTASSNPKAPPATQKKVSAIRPVKFSERVGRAVESSACRDGDIDTFTEGRESRLMLEAQDIEPGSGLSNRIYRRVGNYRRLSMNSRG
jgi:hypothetical protein